MKFWKDLGRPFGDYRAASHALALVLATTAGMFAAQPTPTARPKITQPQWLERPLPDPAEVRKRCKSLPLASPAFETMLGANGVVGKVEFKRGTGCPAADTLLEESVKRWKFKPALQDGKPVDTWVTMVINHLAGE